MKNEHGVEDFRPYKCDQCDYAAQASSIKRGFSNRHTLGCHRVSHGKLD